MKLNIMAEPMEVRSLYAMANTKQNKILIFTIVFQLGKEEKKKRHETTKKIGRKDP